MTTVAEFAQLLNRTTGLSADSVGISVIESAVRKRVQACRSGNLQEYWEHVQASDDELQELIDEVVVPETWFFRDREAFAALVQSVGSLLALRPSGQLRLLSLPCASGEEPYSMAMALLAAGVPGDRFRIDAIDISVRLLQRARQGVYRKNSFRGSNLDYRDRFFAPDGSEFRVADAVRGQVQFRHGNLLDPGLASEAQTYDCIFCRNVLIYFDRTTQDRAIHLLTRLLKADGLLFVGSSECGLMLNNRFVSAKLAQAFAFRNAAQARPEPKTGSERTAKPKGSGAKKAVAKKTSAAAKFKIKRSARVPTDATIASPGRSDTDLEQIFEFANQGRLSEALQRCEEFLRTRGPSVQAYHLMGLVHDATGMHQEAEQYYRKALYLDPAHHEALIHLAFLLEKQGDAAGAQRLHLRAKRVNAGGGV